ncbi:zinc-dependent alcohol dehydrogenase [Legionella gresilensis]|uniref:zinc-dependent alcohol dehydrogenase n=1 Tax=Legionella gresilensis TaxID=91823 RepID=UPI0013EFC088|nr:zinc-binding alcohol dehydrogenase [Legionella gresilensis]
MHQNQQVCFSKSYAVDFISKPVKVVGANEILLKTLISGISAGTEGMWYKGEASALQSGRKNYPYYPGYELIGEVIAVGTEVNDFSLGDKVFAMKPHATHALLGENDIFFKIPSDFNLTNALAISLTGTALHAIHRSNLMIGDQCAVIGMGILGFVLTQVLTNAMSCRVTTVSRSHEKKDLALKLGAQESIDYKEIDKCKENIYCAFDTTGLNLGINAAIRLIHSQGEVIAAGFYNKPLEVDGELLFAKELTLKGVRGVGHSIYNLEFNRWDRSKTMQLACNLVLTNKVIIDSLITHQFKAHNIAEAYQMIAQRQEDYIQILIDWTD